MSTRSRKTPRNSSVFNLQELTCEMKKVSSQVQQIYDCLFGSPDKPLTGLFVQVDRNTRFRKIFCRILLILIPSAIMIVSYLIFSKKGF